MSKKLPVIGTITADPFLIIPGPDVELVGENGKSYQQGMRVPKGTKIVAANGPGATKLFEANSKVAGPGKDSK